VIDCDNGDILAMVSMPAYDPNSFSDGISQSEWKMLSENDHVPLMNKTLQGLYPPGSTVKPMNALALMQAGIDPTRGSLLRRDAGRQRRLPLPQARRAWRRSICAAVMQSCDIYFYEMVRRVGYDAIAPIARDGWGSARSSTCRSAPSATAPCRTAPGS
jgi:penicillin-binding protein 2